jgi:hypothetical protein
MLPFSLSDRLVVGEPLCALPTQPPIARPAGRRRNRRAVLIRIPATIAQYHTIPALPGQTQSITVVKDWAGRRPSRLRVIPGQSGSATGPDNGRNPPIPVECFPIEEDGH